MDTRLFARFTSLLRDLSDDALETEIRQPHHLLLDSCLHGGKRIDVVYAPFEHVTPGARIVLVGLTPGRQQMGNALREARRALRRGLSEAEALAAAKVFASFSGPMRSNLVGAAIWWRCSTASGFIACSGSPPRPLCGERTLGWSTSPRHCATRCSSTVKTIVARRRC